MVNDVGYGHFWLCIILFEVPYLLSIFPLKTWERAPPIFYRISPWDGVEYHRFFFLNLSMLVAEIATRSFGAGCIRHIFGRMKATTTTWPTGNCAWKVSGTSARVMCEWALYHIFLLSVESVVSTERAPGCPEGIDDADKKWGGLFLSRQDSESLSHNHHRCFFPCRWRTEQEHFLFPDLNCIFSLHSGCGELFSNQSHLNVGGETTVSSTLFFF